MTHKIDGGLPAARPPEAAVTSATARAGTERNAPVGATTATDSVRLTGEAEGLQALERQLGNGPASIDIARVNAVRSAIADGSYRVDSQAIATRMLDLDRELSK
ncbi:flagellar biosynthesis anti-sigma factor FlgM [Lysobacter sp. TAF61]|uniref:flagellar biosynthesis anti-sigma factor FlgM n=1 Tax=Lysobacter sp. TAF61 TaxID=3233072 RepID=UPI003F961674